MGACTKIKRTLSNITAVGTSPISNKKMSAKEKNALRLLPMDSVRDVENAAGILKPSIALGAWIECESWTERLTQEINVKLSQPMEVSVPVVENHVLSFSPLTTLMVMVPNIGVVESRTCTTESKKLGPESIFTDTYGVTNSQKAIACFVSTVIAPVDSSAIVPMSESG